MYSRWEIFGRRDALGQVVAHTDWAQCGIESKRSTRSFARCFQLIGSTNEAEFAAYARSRLLHYEIRKSFDLIVKIKKCRLRAMLLRFTKVVPDPNGNKAANGKRHSIDALSRSQEDS